LTECVANRYVTTSLADSNKLVKLGTLTTSVSNVAVSSQVVCYKTLKFTRMSSTFGVCWQNFLYAGCFEGHQAQAHQHDSLSLPQVVYYPCAAAHDYNNCTVAVALLIALMIAEAAVTCASIKLVIVQAY